MPEETRGFTQILASHIVNTTYDDLPPQVVHQTKRMILDLIGCALGGTIMDPGRIVRDVATELGGKPESTIIGAAEKVSCANAAYANARMGNILDAEEAYYTDTHFGSTSLFAPFAVCERQQASGRDLIVAVALAFDIGARIGMALGTPFMGEDSRNLDHERYAISENLTFSAVAGAGKGLGLELDQMNQAIGLAGANVPLESKHVTRLKASTRPTPYYKYGGYDWCAMGGVISALAAQKGFTAFPSILDANSPFWERFQVEKNFELMIGKLGQKWYIMDTTFKPWPCCRLTHPALTAFSHILDENELKPDEIQRVTIYASAVAEAFSDQGPRDMTSSMVTFTYPAAMVAYRIPPGPAWYTPNVMKDPKVQEFKERVFCKEHPAARNIGKWVEDGQWRNLPARVVVAARGKNFESEVEFAKGDPWLPETYMRDDELKSKFRNMASPIKIASERWQEQIERIIDMVSQLEELSNIGELTTLLHP